MSTSDSTIKGKFDEIAGKAKQAFGDATGDQSTANKGAAQEVKGDAEQSWGTVKESAHDATTRNDTTADRTSHDVRDSITSTAENAKNSIQHAFDKDST